MRVLAVSLVVILISTSLGSAQTGAMGGSASLRIEDMSTPVGLPFDIPVLIDAPEPTLTVVFSIEIPDAEVQITGWQPGAALQAYMDSLGDPEICDIFIYPDGHSLLGWVIFYYPFLSTVFGDEWIVLHCEPSSLEPCTSVVGVLSLGPEPTVDTASIAIVPLETPFLLGDVDADGGRNLADALAVLSYLQGQGEPGCRAAADLDLSGTVSIVDAIDLLLVLTGGGSHPLPELCSPGSTSPLPCLSTSCP